MNKLAHIGASSAPVFSRRARAATFRVLYPETRASLVPLARRGLHCGWTQDASGQLTCNWSETRDPQGVEAAPEDKPSSTGPCMRRRGFGRAGFGRHPVWHAAAFFPHARAA